jgi:hypothetical protein
MIAGSPNAIVNYSRVWGTSGSRDMQAGDHVHMETPVGILTQPGVIHHVAMTFHTDGNGLITARCL